MTTDPTRFEVEAHRDGRMTVKYQDAGGAQRKDFFMAGAASIDQEFTLSLNPGAGRPFDYVDPDGPIFLVTIRRCR